MLFVAQRVVSPTRRVQGINAYRYRHEASSEPSDPLALLRAPSKIVERKAIELRPGGNRVISFLDVAAPEGTPLEEVLDRLTDFRSADIPSHFPAERVLGTCAIRFAVEQRLLPLWREEFDELAQRIAAL